MKHKNTGKFVVLGLGKSGCDAVNRLNLRKIESVELSVADDNEDVLNSCSVSKRILLSESVSIDECRKIFTENFHDTDMIFIVDIFGSHKEFARNIAYAAKSLGALTLGIPIEHDEPDRRDLQMFRDYSDAVITLLSDYDDIHDMPGIIVESILDVNMRTQRFRLDFEAVRTVLHNTGTAFLGTVYAAGDDRDSIAAQKISDVFRDIHDVGRIILNIETGKDAELGDIDAVVDSAQKILCRGGHLMLGNSVNEKESMHDAMDITLIMGLKDNGYVNYTEMFENESNERLAFFVKNGLNNVQILRFSSREKFFSHGLKYGTLELIKLFLENGYDPKSLERNGVFPGDVLKGVVSRKDSTEIINMLFSSGITLSDNLVGPFLNPTSPETIKAFINYGWNINSRTLGGITALMATALLSSFGCMKVLIENGADVNARDIKGKNAFMYAADKIYHRPDLVKMFIEAGIDLNAEDNEGNTTMDFMLESVRKEEDDSTRKYNFYWKVLPLMIRSGAYSDVYERKNRFNSYLKMHRCVPSLDYAIVSYDVETVEHELSSLPNEFLYAGIESFMKRWNFSFRTNSFPEAGINPSEKNTAIKRTLDAGARILKLLRKSRIHVPVNAPGGRELTYVISKSDIPLTSYEIYEGEIPDNDFEALCCAYSSGALKALIDSGVDVNSKIYTGQSALKVIAENYKDYYDPEEMIDLLISNGADMSCLPHTWIGECLASDRYTLLGDFRKIKIIMRLIARPEISSLRSAVKEPERIHDYDYVFHHYLLVHMWNNIKSCHSESDSIQHHKNMRLIAASYCGNENDIDDTITDGADVNCRTDLGYTPLMYAAVFNREIMNYLIQKGADVNALNVYGESIIMLSSNTKTGD